MKPLAILLVGKARAGKSTIGKYLERIGLHYFSCGDEIRRLMGITEECKVDKEKYRKAMIDFGNDKTKEQADFFVRLFLSQVRGSDNIYSALHCTEDDNKNIVIDGIRRTSNQELQASYFYLIRNGYDVRIIEVQRSDEFTITDNYENLPTNITTLNASNKFFTVHNEEDVKYLYDQIDYILIHRILT